MEVGQDEQLSEQSDIRASVAKVVVAAPSSGRRDSGVDLGTSFRVIDASGFDEAVAKALSDDPDVIVLLDPRSQTEAITTLQRLAHDERTELLPVIVVANDDALDNRISMLESGAYDVLPTSTDGRELRARIATAARLHARVKTLQRATEAPHAATVPGRVQFDQRLRQEVARSTRSSSPLTMMIVDVDQMSMINRANGQGPGDDLLRELGSLLRSILRVSDVTFHYGRDEFAVILPDTDAGTAYLVAERCRNMVRGLAAAGRPVTISVGISEHSPGRTAEDMVAKAEKALGLAKQSGGNRSWRADDPRRASPTPSTLSQQLTEREWSVLAQLTHRRTEQDIAKSLGISAGTVRSHKARIRRKLHVPPNQRLSEFARVHFRHLLTDNARS